MWNRQRVSWMKAKRNHLCKRIPLIRRSAFIRRQNFFRWKRFLSRPTERIYRSYRSVNSASERKRASKERKEKIKEIKWAKANGERSERCNRIILYMLLKNKYQSYIILSVRYINISKILVYLSHVVSCRLKSCT